MPNIKANIFKSETSLFDSYQVMGILKCEHKDPHCLGQERVEGKQLFKSTLGLFVWRRKFSRYLIRVTGYLIRVTSPADLSKVLSYVLYGSV
jgi:hypothetical protein